MTIFISQPMHGKSEQDIFNTRLKVTEEISKRFGIEMFSEKINIIDNFSQPIINDDENILATLNENQKRIYRLSNSIKKLSSPAIDLVVFTKDWETANGCKVEMMICDLYKIPYLKLEV